VSGETPRPRAWSLSLVQGRFAAMVTPGSFSYREFIRERGHQRQPRLVGETWAFSSGKVLVSTSAWFLMVAGIFSAE